MNKILLANCILSCFYSTKIQFGTVEITVSRYLAFQDCLCLIGVFTGYDGTFICFQKPLIWLFEPLTGTFLGSAETTTSGRSCHSSVRVVSGSDIDILKIHVFCVKIHVFFSPLQKVAHKKFFYETKIHKNIRSFTKYHCHICISPVARAKSRFPQITTFWYIFHFSEHCA